jgi:hypothetical protein
MPAQILLQNNFLAELLHLVTKVILVILFLTAMRFSSPYVSLSIPNSWTNGEKVDNYRINAPAEVISEMHDSVNV